MLTHNVLKRTFRHLNTTLVFSRPIFTVVCSQGALGNYWNKYSNLTCFVCSWPAQDIARINGGNNGEIFLLRRLPQKHLGPSVCCFLATISQPLQVSARIHFKPLAIAAHLYTEIMMQNVLILCLSRGEKQGVKKKKYITQTRCFAYFHFM